MTGMAAATAASRPLRIDGLDVRGLTRGLAASTLPGAWSLPVVAGRLAEISGSESTAALTVVFRLVLEAQREKEPTAWIARPDGSFFPPDVAETGVDLDALAVIRADGVLAGARAADYLVRSGAFGLVVMDLGADARLPVPAQTRLAGLAKRHDTALVCITEKPDHRPSLGSLVSLRAHAAKTERREDRYRCEVRILKDKRRGPGRRHAEVCRGPDGLR